MKICIPTNGQNGLDSQPCLHFGSAPCFVLHDLANAESQIIRNQNEHHEHGQCLPLRALAGQVVDAVVVGGIGARALARLNAAGIRVFQAEEGTVRDNLAAIREGRLREITPETACQGHGHGGAHDHAHGY